VPVSCGMLPSLQSKYKCGDNLKMINNSYQILVH